MAANGVDVENNKKIVATADVNAVLNKNIQQKHSYAVYAKLLDEQYNNIFRSLLAEKGFDTEQSLEVTRNIAKEALNVDPVTKVQTDSGLRFFRDYGVDFTTRYDGLDLTEQLEYPPSVAIALNDLSGNFDHRDVYERSARNKDYYDFTEMLLIQVENNPLTEDGKLKDSTKPLIYFKEPIRNADAYNRAVALLPLKTDSSLQDLVLKAAEEDLEQGNSMDISYKGSLSSDYAHHIQEHAKFTGKEDVLKGVKFDESKRIDVIEDLPPAYNKAISELSTLIQRDNIDSYKLISNLLDGHPKGLMTVLVASKAIVENGQKSFQDYVKNSFDPNETKSESWPKVDEIFNTLYDNLSIEDRAVGAGHGDIPSDTTSNIPNKIHSFAVHLSNAFKDYAEQTGLTAGMSRDYKYELASDLVDAIESQINITDDLNKKAQKDLSAEQVLKKNMDNPNNPMYGANASSMKPRPR